VLLASPVLAETPPAGLGEPLDGEVFEKLVEGRTLTYAIDGGPVSQVERFHPGRRVTWAADGGECLEGRWFPAGPEEAPQICFVYENGSGPFCFLFYRDGDAILSTKPDGSEPAVSTDAPPETALFGCEWLGA
jgi:hypothetical protein